MIIHKRKMKEQWDKIAAENAYFGIDSIPEFEKINLIDEQEFWRRGSETGENLLRDLNLKDISSLEMVEIGCGIGRMTQFFAQKFYKVYAFDVSDNMIQKAKYKWGHLQNIEFILGSGSDLKPVKNKCIDLVFSYIVLQHVLSDNIVLNYIKECSRVLKPEGIAFLQFRTFTPEMRTMGNFVKRTLLFSWRTYIKSNIKRTRPSKNTNPVTNLNEKFNRDFEVWHGCQVSTLAVNEIAKKVKLDILKVEGENTQYTYYTFKKAK
jgi:ubiquinone/menaquinone biosynthesis C-methylase UbiE